MGPKISRTKSNIKIPHYRSKYISYIIYIWQTSPLLNVTSDPSQWVGENFALLKYKFRFPVRISWLTLKAITFILESIVWWRYLWIGSIFYTYILLSFCCWLVSCTLLILNRLSTGFEMSVPHKNLWSRRMFAKSLTEIFEGLICQVSHKI